jgi:hypothetical protein
MNLIRKAFNNKNKKYYINFMSNKNNKNGNKVEVISNISEKLGNNNNFFQKSMRDSKSLNVVRNRSNNNFNNDNNIKKILNINEPYINRLIKMVNIKDKDRNFSVNQKFNENKVRKNDLGYENEFLTNKLNNTHNNLGIIYDSKNEIEENKISENIENKSISTYSIFIFHKYYKKSKKIGLKRIKILDAKKWPVMNYWPFFIKQMLILIMANYLIQ